jgi:hypothetical protein
MLGRFRIKAAGDHPLWYAVAALIAVGLAAASWARAPYLFKVRVHAETLSVPASAPALLFRAGDVCVHYTSRNLLQPESFGSPGQYYQAVVFDIWPGHEGVSLRLSSLTWVREIARVLRTSERPPNDESAKTPVLDEFVRRFGGKAASMRGEITAFRVPLDSPYARRTGIDSFVAMAVKDPGTELPAVHKGKPQLFDAGLVAAMREISNRGSSGVGVPYVPVSNGLGAPQSKADSWKKVIQTVHSHTQDGTLRNVVLGGYGMTKETQAINDREFLQAWKDWRPTLKDQEASMVHEPVRLTAVAGFLGTLAFSVRKRKFTWRRLLAIALLSAGLAISVSLLFGWFAPLIPAVSTPNLQWPLKAGLAAVGGLCLQAIATFDPAKEI